ncbi:MAG TPA: RraA family protein [Verrucomicrobiae bacterium]|nr:RraA family protein [Verrucomicrobiae bacterium]
MKIENKEKPERMNPSLTAQEIETLRRIDACTLANAIETFHERLRNEGFVSHSIGCLFPKLPAVIGYAATIKIRGSAPPTAAVPYAERTDWWDYLLSLPAPRFLAVQDIASKTGVGSLLDAVHVNILRVLGCAGALTNGAVRDLPAIERLGFQVFAGGPCVSHAYIHIVEFGTPVEIGGLKIASGDLLHGDLHGVQSIPLDIAARIPPVAAIISSREKALIDLCQSRDVTIEKLRAATGNNSL